jgi:hypothetical protein
LKKTKKELLKEDGGKEYVELVQEEEDTLDRIG